MPRGWRDLGLERQDEIIQRIVDRLRERFKLGDERYHSSTEGFKGDPFEHMMQELYDAMIYAEVESFKREHLSDGGPK